MKMVGVRAAAEAAGLKRYFTGIPCPHGHVAERFTKGGQCVACNHSRARAWQKANPESISARWAEYHAQNQEELRAKKRAYHRENKEKVNQAKREYMRKHGVRHTKKLRVATPMCLTKDDRQAIQDLYATARELSRTSGTPHEVDHIVPIKGRNVCGLHVPWNLQILTQFANRSKGNRHDTEASK